MITIDKYVYNFSKDNKPAAYADDGDTVKFITLDCYNGQIKEDSDVSNEIDEDRVNPATGPLYVNGAEAGDVLCVEILDIKTADRGVVSICAGPLATTSKPLTRIVGIRDGYALYKDIKIRTDTMIGVIGTATENDTPSSFVFEGGGNIDSSIITQGTKVYLPVRIKGGLLAMGDLHACMGDGEVVGTGLEIAGEVSVRISLIKDFRLNWPLSETADSWYVHTCGLTCDEAITNGYLEMQRLISAAYEWDMSEAAMYMTMQGSLCANQACISKEGGGNSFRIGTPKLHNKKGLIYDK